MVGLFYVGCSAIGGTLKKCTGGIGFFMVAIEFRWLVSQIFSVTNERELAV